MAITDNAFTADEMKGAITANPQLVDVIVGVYPDVPTLKEKIEPIVIGPVTAKHAQTLEKDVLELTGIPKLNPDEKYYDYFKRAVTEGNKAFKKLENELTELKSKGDPSSQEKTRIAQLEKAITEKNTEITNLKVTSEKTLNQTKAQYEIKNVLNLLKKEYKKDIPTVAIEALEERLVGQLSPIVQTKEGKVVVMDSEGNVELDKSNFQPVTIESKAREFMKDLIDPGRKQEGPDTGPKPQDILNNQQNNTNGQKKGPDASDNYKGLPSNVGTKLALSEYLIKLGVTTDNPKFDEILERDGKNLPLR